MTYPKHSDSNNRSQPSPSSCPDCTTDTVITTADGETICDGCGLVLDDTNIARDPGTEPFQYDNEGATPRIGPATTSDRHDKGLGTTMSSPAKGASSNKRRRLHRLKKWHRRSKSNSKFEQNRRTAFIEIRRMTAGLGLPKTLRKQACRLFATAHDEGLCKGRSLEGLATAAIYATCRLNRRPKPLEEFVPVSRVAQYRIRHCYHVLNRELSLPVPPTIPDQYLPQIIDAVGAPHAIQQDARAILESLPDSFTSGKHPSGVAASAVYLAGQQVDASYTQGALAQAASVSTTTVRSNWRDIINIIDDLDTILSRTDSIDIATQ